MLTLECVSQHSLRVDPNSAVAWEALGAAYERMGRLSASLKTYQRVVELDPRRLYSLTQAAAVLSVMGDTNQALEMLDKARAVDPTHPAVLLGIYQTYTQLSSVHASIGMISATYLRHMRCGSSRLLCEHRELGFRHIGLKTYAL